jgi:hypothetical protein
MSVIRFCLKVGRGGAFTFSPSWAIADQRSALLELARTLGSRGGFRQLLESATNRWGRRMGSDLAAVRVHVRGE